MLGFIGAGSMGGAIIRGVIAAGTYKASDIVIVGSTPERSRELADSFGTQAARDARELVAKVGSGVVVVAVKPYAVAGVLDSIRDEAAKAGSIIVSVAAGTTIDVLTSHLDDGQPVVRTMPNVNAALGQSMTGICAAQGVSDDQLAAVTEVFEAVGETTTIAEKDFSAFSALAGCSPAYTFEYIDALARAGVKNGLPKLQAVKIAAQAVLGSAQMVLAGLDSGDTPASLADSVQSPGGTTVAGVVALEEAGFGAAVVKGAQASIDRDTELQG
ncbi:pyrroline-5-carboxylate reductase [Arcanobacterium haemolyticum]|nr:pyrroline-5-carboxylate reductase [Arcanobacterium haemolyticum]